jgi:hypothetical protein
MTAPVRIGIDEATWARARAGAERERATLLRRTRERTDIGGVARLWRPGARTPEQWLIQPGMADDLPSLVSALATELAWPGTQAGRPDDVVAVWACAWQVREAADLRLACWWDPAGAFHGAATLQPVDGDPRPLLDDAGVAAAFDTYAAAPVHSTSPHGLLLDANEAMTAHDFAAARDLYARALVDLPTHPQAHHNLAIALARLGAWEAAADAMRRARELAPRDTQVGQEYLALETDAGVRAVQEHALTRAAEHFLRVLALWPEEPTALANLGNIRLREGRLTEARAIFTRFLRLYPTHPIAPELKLALRAIGS